MENLLASALRFIPIVGPVMAAAPEFLGLFQQIKGMLNTKDQATLDKALELSVDQREAAHSELQELVRQHGG